MRESWLTWSQLKHEAADMAIASESESTERRSKKSGEPVLKQAAMR